MPESRETRWRRRLLNLFPAWRGTGARVTYIASDWREVRVRLPLNWRTRNVVGTIFGGSLYGAADPIYMIMLMRILGPAYVVWDKAATIRFRRPGRTTLYARFTVGEEEIAAIRRALETAETTERVYLVELTDSSGVVHATVEKNIHIRRRT
jgi:acyl-coenzyme A thioesterase PaaI-like protein